MAPALRTTLRLALVSFRLLLKLCLWIIIVGFLVLFSLRFPHSPKVDELSFVIHARRYGDPAIAQLTSWFSFLGEEPYAKYLPLALAILCWMAKVVVDTLLQQAEEKLAPPRRRIPAAPMPVAPLPVQTAPALAPLSPSSLSTLPPQSEQARQELLARYREIEQAIKSAQRKLCTFLSIEVVRPAQLKAGEDPADVAATFHGFDAMLREVFQQYQAWKQASTPEAALACFLQRELAVGAAQRVLQSLDLFNSTANKLQNPFRVRCGIHEGELAIYEDSQLERMVDHVIDVATHLQKQARPNSLWVSGDVLDKLPDKSGFQLTDHTLHGLRIYQWSARAALVPAAEEEAGEAAGAGPAGLRVGRYEILQELGRGAMGAVYKARDPQLGRTVAIKVILTANLSPDELRQYKQRFHREARAAGQMAHPGIVTIHDVAEDDTGQPYLVMEYVEGTTLDNLASPPDSPNPPKRLPFDQTLGIASQVAKALDYAHRRGVVHRDIKPANILVTPDGEAKIADFGVAKLAGTELTQTGQLIGTPAFMSPEQFTGDPVDARSDIFSFGAVVYWMLTGEKPFPGDTVTQVIFKVIQTPHTPVRSLNPALPPEVETIVARCLAKKPEDRYANARALADDVEAVMAGRPLASLPSPS